MKCKNLNPKKRRGLSSLVGALIFTVLMVATFTVLGEALDSQTTIVETNMAVASKELEKVKEQFDIDIFTDSGQILTVNVDNNGQNPVEIFNLVITNYTGVAAAAADYPTRVHNIAAQTSFVAAGDIKDVVSATPLKLDLAGNPGDIELYHFKVVSSLGTIKTETISCDDTACGASNTGLSATLFLSGPNAINSKNSTAVMFVSNSYDVSITDVEPTAGFTPVICDDLWTADDTGATEAIFVEDVDPCTVTPNAAITLGPHETALFKWDGTIAGDIGAEFTFCSAVSGTHPDLGPITSGAPSCDALTVINPNDCGGCDGELRIFTDQLLIRPSIFMTIPSPFGDSTHDGIWGVNIANPTNATISVNRVVIAGVAPGSQDQDILFDDSGGSHCDPRSVGSVTYPAVSDDWECNQENVLYWENVSTPVSLPPYSVQSFLAKARPGNSGGSVNEPNTLILSANVFSTMGSFNKGNYQTVMIGGTGVNPGLLANVYLSSVSNGSADNEIEASRMNIPANSVQTFNIVLTDFDEDINHAIDTGAKLIINVPRDWTNVVVDSHVGFSAPTIQLHDEGTTQIIGTTNQIIGDVNNSIDSRTITFHATAPDVKYDTMQVMYVFANGVTIPDEAPIGPLSEIILHMEP